MSRSGGTPDQHAWALLSLKKEGTPPDGEDEAKAPAIARLEGREFTFMVCSSGISQPRPRLFVR